MLVYLLPVAVILCIIHCYFRYNEKTRLIRKIPGPRSTFLLGNALEIFISPVKLFSLPREYAQKFNGIYSFWMFQITAVNIYNPEDIEMVISKSDHMQKGPIYLILKPWLREGLLLSEGTKWHQRRKILTPTFHFNILRQFHTTLEDNSQRLVDNLLRMKRLPVDIVPVLSEYTLSSICETAMGSRLHEQTMNAGRKYKEAVYELGKAFIERFSKVYYYSDFIFNLSSVGRKANKNLNTVQSFTKRVIQERKEFIDRHGIQIGVNAEETNDDVIFLNDKKKRVAMLDLLISAEKEGVIDDDGIQEEVDTFTFEGHDTTASAITFLFMLLANHKNIQDKIVAELNEIFVGSNRVPTMEDLSNMRYLECCIKESLRLYPPVPFISRLLTKDVKLSNYVVPAGSNCCIHIFDLHRRADLYEDPLVFDPDRFLPENCIGRHPYAYIPFSAGPRNCIGQRFAMIEMKSCVAAVLRSFVLLPVTKPSELQFSADIVLRNAGPVYVNFERRYLK